MIEQIKGVTPSLHPSCVSAMKGYSDEFEGVSQPTVNALTYAYQGVGAVIEGRAKSKLNPEWNEAKQLLATADLAAKYYEKSESKLDYAQSTLVHNIDLLKSQIEKPITQDAAKGPINGEIREHAKHLERGERNAFIKTAIENLDTTTASAILGAPCYLSGFTENELKVYGEMFHEKKSPQLTKKLRFMEKTLQLVNSTKNLLLPEFEKAVGADTTKIARLRASRTESERAFIMTDFTDSSLI